jgi:ubiquinone/menaquinone biosynthesis C-methylase UbiE
MTVQRDPEERELKHLHAFADFAGARVLEIGCGEGRLTWRYAGAAAQVVGVDPDPVRLDVASREIPPGLRSTVTFALAKAEALPFPRETFDLAVLAWSL